MRSKRLSGLAGTAAGTPSSPAAFMDLGWYGLPAATAAPSLAKEPRFEIQGWVRGVLQEKALTPSPNLSPERGRGT